MSFQDVRFYPKGSPYPLTTSDSYKRLISAKKM